VEVSVTLPPAHIVVLPLAVIIGTGGLEFTVTTVATETAVHPDAFVTVTV
jgi:hypothetical protein